MTNINSYFLGMVLWLVLFFGMPADAASQTGTDASSAAVGQAPHAVLQNSKEITPAIEQKVRTFLDSFVDADKTAAEQAAFFAERAEYYGVGIVGHAAIMRDVNRYIRHWPYRSYRVAEISYMAADPASDRLFVAYSVDFEVANHARAITGKADYGAVIGNLNGSPRIESIKERVISRKADSVPNMTAN